MSKSKIIHYIAISVSIISGGWLMGVSESMYDDLNFALIVVLASLCFFICILTIFSLILVDKEEDGKQLRGG